MADPKIKRALISLTDKTGCEQFARTLVDEFGVQIISTGGTARVLKEAGIRNYTIWLSGQELFGYYECEQGVAYAARVQTESPVVQRWDAYMKDILIMEKDPVTGAQPQLTKVFELD